MSASGAESEAEEGETSPPEKQLAIVVYAPGGSQPTAAAKASTPPAPTSLPSHRSPKPASSPKGSHHASSRGSTPMPSHMAPFVASPKQLLFKSEPDGEEGECQSELRGCAPEASETESDDDAPQSTRKRKPDVVAASGEVGHGAHMTARCRVLAQQAHQATRARSAAEEAVARALKGLTPPPFKRRRRG